MIRSAELKDAEAVYRIVCELENTELDHEDFVRIYKAQLASPAFFTYVYELDDKVIGMMNMRLEEQLHHAGAVMEIIELCVTDGWRSMGIGAKFMEFAKEVCMVHRVQRLELSSSTWREDAHRFYESQGMDMSHINMTYDFTYEDEK